MSDLYLNVACIFDDPTALACAYRELQRRQNIKLLLPPIMRAPSKGAPGGPAVPCPWVYLTFRGALKHTLKSQISDSEDADSIFELFNDGRGWFIRITASGTEVGPFDNLKRANTEVKSLATGMGYTCLDKFPWDEDDLSDFPL